MEFGASYLNQQSLAKTSNWELPINVSGVGGTVFVKVDSFTPQSRVVAGNSSATFNIDAQDSLLAGAHTIEVWATDDTYGLTSDHIKTQFIKAGESAVVALGSNPAEQVTMYDTVRIPYFFVREGQKIAFDRILVPVGFLMEEREKGPFSSSFGRFFDSEILLMPAKDYGSKARQNTDAIKTVIEKSDIKNQEISATKDSFKVELEAAQLAPSIGVNLLMISASRDYGLDDIIFGPKERKVINQCAVPVMVINPRGDLYALCG